MRILRLILLCAVIGACNKSPSETELPTRQLPAEGFNVLFIGNSLTYWNALPALVSALADSAKLPELNWAMVAYPDYNLEDHWARGDAPKAIALGNWDYVVLQQGPSSVLVNREQLINSTRMIDVELRRVNARAALYSVWPQISRQQDFPAAIESYRLAAETVNGLFLPVASAWLIAADMDRTIALYSQDGLHPSPAGSYLAALVMFQQLYDRSPVGLPARVRLDVDGAPILSVTAAQAATLQAAAAEAVSAAQRR
jgi:hypothetical protein